MADDDFIRLHMVLGTKDFLLSKFGLSWPPPECLVIENGKARESVEGDPPAVIMKRIRMSVIPDDVAEHPNIARGAEYRYERTD